MKTSTSRILLPLTLLVMNLFTPASQAGDVDIDLHLAVPPPPPARVVRPVHPRPAAPVFHFRARPDFIFMDSLGFYMAINTPYDIFFFDNVYYILDNGYWYSSAHYNGPWIIVDSRRLPPRFLQHSIDHFRRLRDEAYRRSHPPR